MSDMSEKNTLIVDRAMAFAILKHSGTFRKGTEIPYITHPMEAAAIVAGMTDDQELIAAAVLHDTLEDTDTELDELKREFNERVANLVAAESEDKQKGRPAESSWKERKQATLDELKQASPEIRLLALADKLSNIRAIQRDYERIGEKLWDRFNQKDPKEHGWYYSSLATIFLSDPELKNTQACREYDARVKAVFG